MRTDRGFTLAELLVAMAMSVVLVASAARAWSAVVVKANAGTVRSELAADLALSITRSIGRSDRLVFCPSADGVACLDSFDWSRGWVAFTNPDSSRRRSADSLTVTVHGPVDAKLRLLSTTGRRSIQFRSGGLSTGSNLTFTLCDRQQRRAIDILVLSNPGRLHREEATPAADALCADPGPTE